MKRTVWLIFAALALIPAGVLFQYDSESVAMSAPPRPVEQQPASVRVSHEFITVPISTASPDGPADRRLPGKPQTMLAGPSSGPRDALRTVSTSGRNTGPAVRRAARDQNIFEKAGRAFVGDGRHRPEPFPRIRDN